jgi:hypothetical protein
MRATNYFRTRDLGKPDPGNFFPFDGSSHEDTARAWELVLKRARYNRDRIVAYERPRGAGAWLDVRVVGELSSRPAPGFDPFVS